MFDGGNPYLDHADEIFVAQVTAVASGSGALVGLNLYSWIEQTFDASTGLPLPADPARSGTASVAYALELNNVRVTALPTYVWMRLRSIVQGVPVYEFDARQSATVSGGSGGSVSTVCLEIPKAWSCVNGVGTMTTQFLVVPAWLGVYLSDTCGSVSSGGGSGGSGGSGGISSGGSGGGIY